MLCNHCLAVHGHVTVTEQCCLTHCLTHNHILELGHNTNPRRESKPCWGIRGKVKRNIGINYSINRLYSNQLSSCLLHPCPHLKSGLDWSFFNCAFLCAVIIISCALCIIYIVKKRKAMPEHYPECTHWVIFFWKQNLGKSCREQRLSLYTAQQYWVFFFFPECRELYMPAYWKFADGGNSWHIYLGCSSCIWQINLKTSKPKFNIRICKHSKTMWNR